MTDLRRDPRTFPVTALGVALLDAIERAPAPDWAAALLAKLDAPSTAERLPDA